MQGQLLPLLTDAVVLGHPLAALERACGEEVHITLCRQSGPVGVSTCTCTLEVGQHHRTWRGTCFGEVVALALVARRAALDRGRAVAPGERSASEPQGWAQGQLARAREEVGRHEARR